VNRVEPKIQPPKLQEHKLSYKDLLVQNTKIPPSTENTETKPKNPERDVSPSLSNKPVLTQKEIVLPIESKLMVPNIPTKPEPTKEQPKTTEKKVETPEIKQPPSLQSIKTESPIIDKTKQETFKSITSNPTEQKPILAHENNKVETKPVTISPTVQLIEQKNLTETTFKPEVDTKPAEQVITLSEGEQKNNAINEPKKSKKKRSAVPKTEESSTPLQKQPLQVMHTEETESANLPETSILDPQLQKQPSTHKDTKKEIKKTKE